MTKLKGTRPGAPNDSSLPDTPLRRQSDYDATIPMGDSMKLQRKAQLCAIIFSAAALFLLPSLASVQTHPTTQSLDGQWLTDGYGEFVEFQGDSLRGYEITTLSCMASAQATRKTAPSDANESVFVGDDGGTFRISPATSVDTRWLHKDGSVSSIMLRRVGSRPEPCAQPLADTPLTKY